MINLIQFSPYGALVVCIIAWIRIVMLNHKIDHLEKIISILKSDINNSLSEIWQKLNHHQHVDAEILGYIEEKIDDLILNKKDK